MSSLERQRMCLSGTHNCRAYTRRKTSPAGTSSPGQRLLPKHESLHMLPISADLVCQRFVLALFFGKTTMLHPHLMAVIPLLRACIWTHSGTTVVRLLDAARSVSPPCSRRVMARKAARTYFRQRSSRLVSTVSSIPCSDPISELREDGEVKAQIGPFQTEDRVPVNPALHQSCCLPIRVLFHSRHHQDQCHSPRRGR